MGGAQKPGSSILQGLWAKRVIQEEADDDELGERLGRRNYGGGVDQITSEDKRKEEKMEF